MIGGEPYTLGLFDTAGTVNIDSLFLYVTGIFSCGVCCMNSLEGGVCEQMWKKHGDDCHCYRN